MAYVNPGELRYEIELIDPRRELDESGHYVEAPVRRRLRAAVRAASAKDAIESGAERARETLQFIIRWRSRGEITSDMRISWQNREYAITFVDPTPWAQSYCRIRATATGGA